METLSNAKLRADLQSAFFQRLSQALEAMIGAAPVLQISDISSPTGGQELPANATVWQAIFSSGPEASVNIFASAEAWHGIGRHVLEAAGIEDLDEASVKSTYTETIGQAAAAMWQDFSALTGSKWELASSGLVTVLPDAAWTLSIQVSMQTLSVIIHVSFSQALMLALAQPASTPEIPQRQVQESIATSNSPFELLFDVELPVSVSFGRALVPLKEILKLNSGSIVELNRAVTEPVEVIINNCVIARGEVVVVEGNYGVRIQQIISRQERLRSLN